MIDTPPICKTLDFDDPHLASILFGSQNNNLNVLAKQFGTSLSSRGSTVSVTASDANTIHAVTNLLTQLYSVLKAGHPLYPRDILYAYSMLEREPGTDLMQVFKEAAFVVSPRKTITAKTLSQRDYIAALRANDMVFAVGPAGTGKTYLAMAMALASLTAKKVKRIILTRPAVEAGEKLGFLPGDMVEKVNPYLRPLYDALYDMLEFEKVSDMLEKEVIEIAPLAFMRGRTLSDAFIILDEAQNTTPEQMKMFLTRMGFGSQAVITGDITQIDLPGVSDRSHSGRSGLVQARRILSNVDGIRFLQFHEADVVRHPLVGKIVHAYERFEHEHSEKA